MGRRLKLFTYRFWRHKYLWTFLIFVLVIGFLDNNSIWQRLEIRRENRYLREKIRELEIQCSRDSAKLSELKSNPDAVTRVAREIHLMKAADEDVYLVSEVPSDSSDLNKKNVEDK